VNTIANEIRGVRIVEQPSTLRHFTAKFAPVCDVAAAATT
jgi:tryptophanase